MKTFFKNNWQHFAAIAVMFIITLIYCSPVLDGYSVRQHDVTQFKGMANEISHYREKTGEEPLWTNSMFGGMPAMQISVIYAGNMIRTAMTWYENLLGRPVGLMFAHMLGFYILALFLRIRPLVAMLGAIAMTFASYEIVIIQAGHNSKSMATAFMAPVLGAFVYAYRSKKLKLWMFALAGLFMAMQLATNHIQVTYYLAILLAALGVYYLVAAIVQKNIKHFAITTVGLLGVYGLAVLVNIGNLTLSNDYATQTTRGGNDITINPDGTPVAKLSTGLDRDYITNWSYGIGETMTLLSPNVKGGGTFAFQGSQFESAVEKAVDNGSIDASTADRVMSYPVYWGEQPFTSGPVYLGTTVVVLAILGLIYIPGRWKWFYLAVAVLATMLSWGKNFMGLTDFFIDHVPGYAKFRTVTIILVIVELIFAVLAMAFLEYFLRNKELFRDNQKKFFISAGAILGVLLIFTFVGLKDGYSNEFDRNQIAQVESSVMEQLMQMGPEQVQAQLNIDLNNSQQVQAIVDQQVSGYAKTIDAVKIVRADIFKASMLRSLFFTALILGLLFIYIKTSNVKANIIAGLAALLVLFDLVPVATDYLGTQEEGSEYKYYMDGNEKEYPLGASVADMQIMEKELAANPNLVAKVKEAEAKAQQYAYDHEFTPLAAANYTDAKKFLTLNEYTNYRVFEPQGGFNSSRASYFHKSLGGYHGAKLRNIQNLVEFQLAQGNNKVYDMLNVKYIIQGSGANSSAQENPNAAGNAWLVKKVDVVESENDEIRKLGMEFQIKNSGQGKLLINRKEVAEATVFGAEKMQYVLSGMDTITIAISAGIPEGLEAVYVMDNQGKTSFVMPQVFDNDTARNSFLRLANVKAVNDFKLKEEAIMLASEAKKLSQREWSGNGTVKMTSYAPNKLVYQADLADKQLVVFSEIYYNQGWKLFVDGKEQEILKVNYLLRGAEIAAGKHKVEMVFDVPAFKKSNTIAMTASIALLALLVGGIVLEKRKKEDEAA